MEKVAIYCRVSTEEQRERESIQTQIEYAKEYCQKQGYLIHDFYCDDGVSGTIPFEEREAGSKLFFDARKRKFKFVLVWKIDRLARDTKLTLTVVHILNELGICIKSMTEPFDTSTPIGEFMLTQLASFAKLERDNTRERSIAGTNRIIRQGKWGGGITPYGYKVEDGYLVANEANILSLDISEAEVVRMIYNWIGNEGLSAIEVARRLNAMNIPPHYAKDGREFILPPQNRKGGERVNSAKGKRKVKTSGLWHPHRIANLVHNTTYMGVHNYGKRSKKQREIIERNVSSIVSSELWHKAQEVLKNNFLWATRNSRRPYLLRGLIKCDVCGRNYIGSYSNKGLNSWYRCNGKSVHVQIGTGKGACPCKSVPAEWIENLVWEELKDWILRPESLKQILSERLEDYEKEKNTWFLQLKRIKADIAHKEEERFRIQELYRKNLIDMPDLERHLRDIDSEKAELEIMEADLKTKMLGDFSKEGLVREIRAKLDEFRISVEKDNISWEDKRKIVEVFVKEVRIKVSKDFKTSILIETIPFRKEVDYNWAYESQKPYKENIYVRLSDKEVTNSFGKLDEDTINIIYRFPLPSQDIGSIINRTGKDS